VSVHFGNGVKVTRTSGLPSTTVSFSLIIVFKPLSYGTDFMQVFEVTGSGGIALGIDSDENNANVMAAYVFDGSFQALDLAAANSTAWIGVAFTHDGAGTAYKVYKVVEGDTSATLVGTLDVGAEGSYTAAGVGDDPGVAADVDVTSFGFFASELTSGQVYTAITNLARDGSADNTWLQFASGATAGTNAGTAGNYTATGTPTTSASEPAFTGSDASSAPTLTAGATGASKATADASSAPTLSGAATGASKAAAAASSAPTLSAGATGQTAGSAASSSPTLTAGATGASLAAAAASSAPTMNAAATAVVPRTLYFRDDFNGSDVDSAIWIKEHRQGDPANSELHCYEPGQVATTGGDLVITAEVHTQSCGDASNSPTSHAYRSGQITQKLAPFRYGRITWKSRAPGAAGCWPIVWLRSYPWQPAAIADPGDANPPGADWPNAPWGEVDLWELGNNLGHNLNSGFVNQIIHNNSHLGGMTDVGFDPTAAQHDYEVIWTAGQMIWKADGVTTKTITNADVPSDPMFLSVGIAVGGVGGGTPTDAQFPSSLTMDFIQVESDTGNASSAPTLNAAATGASLAAAAASSAPTLSAGATGASLAAGAASSAPTLTGGATAASKAATDASSAPTMTANASAMGGASDASSAPSLSAGATGVALFAGAASSAPTLSAGAVGASLAAAAASSAPTFSAAPVGAVLYAAAASSAPTLSAGAGSAIGPRPDSQPTLSANATGKSLAAADASSAPTMNAIASMQFNGIPSGDGRWRPDWWHQGWFPDFIGGR
jgi:hypothetical protein